MESHDLSSITLSAKQAQARHSRAWTDALFEKNVPELGRLWIRPLRMPVDLSIIHSWVSQPYAKYWGLVDHSLDQVAATYADIMQRAEVYLGFHDDAPAFLVECYDPAQDPISAHYAVEPGDRGMHVLVAPSTVRLPEFTWRVFGLVMDALFADPTTMRIIVEPHIRNRKIHALNRRAGFRYQRPVVLPHKIAHLAFCTRQSYQAALARELGVAPADTQVHDVLAHLQSEVWLAAHTALVRKIISEFAHELLVCPVLEREDGEWADYALTTAGPQVAYRFRARRLALDHWDIDAPSLEKRVHGKPVALDAMDLVLELAQPLGMDATVLPVYLEEITSTLYASAYKLHHQALSAADLVHADFQEIEAAMTEGHPCFVANSGRVGFDATDHVAYAPEAASPVQLVWLAAHRRNTTFTAIDGLSYEGLLREELGETFGAFCNTLRQLDLDPESYLFMPVHPWQWSNRLAQVFASEVATRDLVCLGYGPDRYRAQQSIRTFFNQASPHKHYVKTALSVLNMGFMRGLSAEYMQSTPPINDWLHTLVENDPYFARQGFGILREVAGVGYRNPCFEAAEPKGSPYRKMLAALWRESPIPTLKPGQRLMTMAALLHRDRQGVALLPQLIMASGLDTDTWLDRYLACYLAPLVHAFLRYDLAFMPHGENVILVLEDNVPTRALMKDLAEEIVVMDGAADLPERVQRIRAHVPDAMKPLCVFTDVFDGILRYLSQILVEQSGHPEQRFWERVANCLHEYEREHPELCRRFDLFVPVFSRSCLNRLQLRNNQQMVDLTDPTQALQFAGTLVNPIARFRSSSGPVPARTFTSTDVTHCGTPSK